MNAWTDLHLLAASGLLTWVMIMTSSTLRARTYTLAGLRYGLGNRESPPTPSALALRADRAASNMIENLVVFTALLLAARGLQAPADKLRLGAHVFFWARLAYFLLYLSGIPYVRSLAWGVSLVAYAILLSVTFAP